MDKFILSLPKRILLPVVFAVGLMVWLLLCRVSYKSYWDGTIERVQTVDFNILHHTLPTTLSWLILSSHDESLQKVLDSNYGIFGLVITDPGGKNIIYKTEKFYKDKTWQPLLNAQYLSEQSEPYDLLTDPPPVVAQYQHSGPRASAAVPTGKKPAGRVIGRVYYIRGVPPSFPADLLQSISTNWFELSGAKRFYVLLTLNVLAFAISIIFLVLWRQEWLENRVLQLETVERELTVRRRALDNLNSDLMAQRQRKEWLESEADLAYRRAVKLKESLEKLKEVFFLVDMSPTGLQPQANPITVKPPLHPPSAVIEEVENLLPELTNNARILKSQAEVLQSYCTQLENRQQEMQRILEQTQSMAKQAAVSLATPQLKRPLPSEQSAP